MMNVVILSVFMLSVVASFNIPMKLLPVPNVIKTFLSVIYEFSY